MNKLLLHLIDSGWKESLRRLRMEERLRRLRMEESLSELKLDLNTDDTTCCKAKLELNI